MVLAEWQGIATAISNEVGVTFTPQQARWVGGGCINQALELSGCGQRWFVKLNQPQRLSMFEAEAAGLQALGDCGQIRVPRPLCHGVDGRYAFLVLEYVEMGAARKGSSANAGQSLAALHSQQAERFGWQHDNTIGSTPQLNGWMVSWLDFWRERRLGYQLGLAAHHGYGGRLQKQGEQLLERLPLLLGHGPRPSLLHGDLWGGNVAYDQAGRLVLFDPAVYYGDRETDLAMTELFGGFDSDFYAAYRECAPIDSGYPVRRVLYNLYHILNHLNLFGGGYLDQALSMMARLLSEC